MSVGEITEKMDVLCEDRAVPSNVRRMIKEAAETLKDNDEELSVRVNTAISLLDDASNDPNLARFTRTEIWSLASLLETIQ
jgi:uncharacterized protein (UPF0147 family)